MNAAATPANASAVNPIAKSRMSIPFLEWASYWSGVAAGVLAGFAAIAGFAAWFFSSKLSDAREADLKRYREESSVAVASANSKAAEANQRAAEANKIAEEERLARVKLEARLGPRIALLNQKELTARLSQFKGQRGTIVASPSSPESVHFAMALTAALTAAGWDIEQLPAIPGATVIFPTGVIISYPITGRVQHPPPHETLASALNEWGIAASVTGGLVKPSHTIKIVVSDK